MKYKIIDGSITAPKGFSASAVHAGIRKKKLDLALIYSHVPAVAAGVTTKNKLKAAPVLLTKKHLKEHSLQAIIVNSGNANACTGKAGMVHAKKMAMVTANALGLESKQVAVASTGVIGVPLPIDNITSGIKHCAENIAANDSDAAALAIMTTDTFPKKIAIELELGGKIVKIGGISKGSGMIHPNMATMLGFITTDAAISPHALQQALSKANASSFNMISVDGETSTNDMVIVLANGLANNPCIDSNTHPDWQQFVDALMWVCTYLAKEIARDGEGASKLIEIHVCGAASEKQARLAARAISSSPLVKTAIHGADANWGRIACAVGYSGARINLNKLKIAIHEHILFANHAPQAFDEAVLAKLLQQNVISLTVDLGVGQAQADAWGCDLSHDYVNINASYRS
ncbi:MAG: bifunctional glutamate N-acetyltransferase/amino-acid acetyltransferase ArgJ [Legionellales bacterium]|nr:bifunctional glutamate N-acetyltransferase/amino-acid acetyltransferase ArgJ [Legionellales bacterium]